MDREIMQAILLRESISSEWGEAPELLMDDDASLPSFLASRSNWLDSIERDDLIDPQPEPVDLANWPATAPRWKLTDYIREEVRRQGHNLSDPHDGGLRVKWMTDAWEFTRRRFLASRPLSIEFIQELGARVEPEKNREGFRRGGVRISGSLKVFPPGGDVYRLIGALIRNGKKLSPLEFYKEILEIHPFRDGNGRMSKCLLAFRQAALTGAEIFDAPYFPPADLFGAPIVNP